MAGIAEIREQIVRDPIAGAKSLCDYLATRPAWAARRAEADLKRSDLERIQHELDLYGPDPGLQAARNRNVHFLIQLCLEIEAELCPGPAIPPDLYEIRARQLADHIAQDLALLKEYEDGLRYEEDPRRRARYRREIERLQESLQKYRREYEDLQAQVAGAPSLAMDRVGFQLQQMDAKLDTLLQGQTAIRTDVAGVRQALLDRYEAGERTIIASIAESLNQGQLATVEGVLNAIEEGRIAETEMVEMLDSVRQILTNVEQHLVSLLPAQPRVSEIVSSPELDVKHKLKITLPIIPLLLSYEGELGLGMRANLEEMWRRLLGKVKRPNRLCDTKDLRDIRDILASLAKPGAQRPALVIGFAAETDDVVAHAQAKRARKGCDWIVANDVSGDVLGGDENTVHFVTADGVESWPRMRKEEVARRLAARIAAVFA